MTTGPKALAPRVWAAALATAGRLVVCAAAQVVTAPHWTALCAEDAASICARAPFVAQDVWAPARNGGQPKRATIAEGGFLGGANGRCTGAERKPSNGVWTAAAKAVGRAPRRAVTARKLERSLWLARASARTRCCRRSAAVRLCRERRLGRRTGSNKSVASASMTKASNTF